MLNSFNETFLEVNSKFDNLLKKTERLFEKISFYYQPDYLKIKLNCLERLSADRRLKNEHIVLFPITFDGKATRKIIVGHGNENEAYLCSKFNYKVYMNKNIAGFVIAHNHPDCTALPSDEDKGFTSFLKKEAQRCGTRLFDHLIVSNYGEYSFHESNEIV